MILLLGFLLPMVLKMISVNIYDTMLRFDSLKKLKVYKI